MAFLIVGVIVGVAIVVLSGGILYLLYKLEQEMDQS